MKTVIFWGAGATASLGIRTTREQSAFIQNLALPDDTPTDERVRKALEGNAHAPWDDALRDLLTILGDGRSMAAVTEVDDREVDAMRRNWTTTDDLRRRIRTLRATYDWPSLKVIVKACPGSISSEGQRRVQERRRVQDQRFIQRHGSSQPKRPRIPCGRHFSHAATGRRRKECFEDAASGNVLHRLACSLRGQEGPTLPPLRIRPCLGPTNAKGGNRAVGRALRIAGILSWRCELRQHELRPNRPLVPNRGQSGFEQESRRATHWESSTQAGSVP